MSGARPLAASYVLPLRHGSEEGTDELGAYVRWLTTVCEEVIVVDGSPPDVFAAHAEAFGELALHIPPDPARACPMGKVAGVNTGVARAAHERVVIADDDVRYDDRALARTVALLERHDLVRPQNYFSPLPWHALWDTARTLLNRSLGADFPGTLGVRRSRLLAAGGYAGDVIFENLELIRTIAAAGGTVASPLDLYVRRLPPSSAHFWGQRTRQAYDDFAIPARMVLWLALGPALVVTLLRRRRAPAGVGALATIALAERGRRRAGGVRHFPAAASLLAPVWVAERALCSWLALLQRVRYGGVRYNDAVIATAAHSSRSLRRRLAARTCAVR